MYGLTQQQALNSQKDLMSKFNPSNPEHVKKMKELTGMASGGRFEIKTAKEMSGMGISDPNATVGSQGFTVVESEEEKQKYNPNSLEFKKRQNAVRQERAENNLDSNSWETKFVRGNPNLADAKFGPNNANSSRIKFGR